MAITATLGTNRTGFHTAPGDSDEMLESVRESPPAPGSETAFAAARVSYMTDAERLGSVPPPPSLKGIVKSGIKVLTGKRPQTFIDRLAERLAFERTGVRLYDALLAKHEARANDVGDVPAEKLRGMRNDELSHFILLAECLQSLGADPTVETPCADLAGVESSGLICAITDARTTFAQSVHAILVAELTDNASWELLIQLARTEGQDDMADRFQKALETERVHLDQVRTWLTDLTMNEAVIGAAARTH
jgi:rubrerythrin